jgi:hypothetical protein
MNRPMLWLAALALLACALPWVSNPGAGLSLNPVDLAEWTSLHPAIQAQSPPLLTTLLLRTPLLVVAALIGLSVGRAARWPAALAIAALAVAQLPPFEFVRDFESANYRQQALMAALTLAGGWLALFAIQRGRAGIIGAVVALAGLIAAVFGAAGALGAMRDFGLPAQPGPGLFVYGAALAGVSVLPFARYGIKKRRALTPPSEQA